MRIINQSKSTTLAENAILAAGAFSRMKGLLGRKELTRGSAMVLKPCNSVHTLFMRFAIDALFVDKENRVIKIIQQLKPWRLSGVYFSASQCIELPAGTIASTSTCLNDQLSFTE